MADEFAKVRLKFGALEVEYEGASSFLNDGISNLVQKFIEMVQANGVSAGLQVSDAKQQNDGTAKPPNIANISTNTIATHVGGSNSSDLILAAAASLAFVSAKDTFTRQEIHDEMKSATTFYNSNMGGNLSKNINTLVKNKRLNQIKPGVFALSLNEKKSLEAAIAQIG